MIIECLCQRAFTRLRQVFDQKAKNRALHLQVLHVIK